MNVQEACGQRKHCAEACEATIGKSNSMPTAFEAAGEQDIHYVTDELMHTLWNLMKQGADADAIYRDWLAYVSSLDAGEVKSRYRDIEEPLSGWIPAVIAAGMVAREVHQGQRDKGGNDYFESHLLPVAKSGSSWKEMIVGFLHDAIEDTNYDVETLFGKIKVTLHELSLCQDDEWKRKPDMIPCPGSAIVFPSEADWKEMGEALAVLNHHTAPDRKEYIQRFQGNELALRVKLNDMRNNMDISRIPFPASTDYQRLERYNAEYKLLIGMLTKGQ